MFDSHCHLDFAEFEGRLDNELGEARAAGIDGWFVPGCAPSRWDRVARLRGLEGVVIGHGVHPWWAHEVSDCDETMARLAARLSSDGAVALGECGLDALRLADAPLAHQLAVFEAQLRLARELGLPVVLHQVRARQEFEGALRRVGWPTAGAVVHGFSGDRAWAQTLVRGGVKLGVGAALLRAGRDKLREALREAPLEALLLETDAPDQGIDGNPGRLSDLLRVASALASLKNTSFDSVITVCSTGAREMFGVSGHSGAAPADGVIRPGHAVARDP